MLTRRHFLSFFLFFFRGGQRSNGDGREGGREDRRCGLFGGTAHTRAQVIWKGIGTSEHRHIAAHRTHPASSMRPCPASASLLQGNPRPRRQPGKRKKKKRSRDNPNPQPWQTEPTESYYYSQSGVVLARTITLVHVRGYSCKVL